MLEEDRCKAEGAYHRRAVEQEEKRRHDRESVVSTKTASGSSTNHEDLSAA